MAASNIASTEAICRAHYANAIEGRLPIAPVAKAILDTFLTETASHVGAEKLKGSRATDPSRFVVHLAISVLCSRYSSEVVSLILSLDNGNHSGAH
jgi:hypothetical protein